MGPDLPSVFVAPDDAVFSKNLNNIEQVKARKGPIIALTSGDGAKRLKGIAERYHRDPECSRIRYPGLNSDSASVVCLSRRS